MNGDSDRRLFRLPFSCSIVIPLVPTTGMKVVLHSGSLPPSPDHGRSLPEPPPPTVAGPCPNPHPTPADRGGSLSHPTLLTVAGRCLPARRVPVSPYTPPVSGTAITLL